MRRGSVLNGLKSAFTRAAHQVKAAFFGWRGRDEEERSAAALAVAESRVFEPSPKPASDDDGGDGEDGSAPMPSLGRKVEESEDARPERKPNRAGFDQDGKPVNYAIPPGVSEEEWEREVAEERRRQLQRQRQRRENEIRRERQRKARSQQPRERDASRGRGPTATPRTRERLESLQLGFSTDQRGKAGDDPGYSL